jgi:hypothetical protein
MNDGVAMLLERMKTHPEEFAGDSPAKWKSLVDNYRPYLNKEELKLLDIGMAELMQQRFTEKVMEELIDPKSDSLEDVINQYRVKGMPSVGQTLASSMVQSKAMSMGATLTTTASANSITLGSTTINEETLKHIQAHKTYLDAQKPKEHKTLFGKLFSYL